MAGRESGWAMPPPPTYLNALTSGGDQPPSYEEALMDMQSHPSQAPVAAYSAFPGPSPLYPPLPQYQPQIPGTSSLSPYPPHTPGAGSQLPCSTQASGASSQMHYPPQASGPSSQRHYPAQNPGAGSTAHSTQRGNSFEVQRVMSTEELMEWWRTVKPWEKMTQSPDTEPRMLAKKVLRVQRATQLYRLLMNTHGQVLQMHINEMQRSSEAISKAYNALKAAGVTRGTTGAVGGAAAVTGIVLAPFTMGASLAITAVGIGVAAAGGLTKASVKNKMFINQDRRALEANVQDYRNKMEDIENCIQFIYKGMEHVGRNNLSILKGADMDAGQVARMLELSGEVAQGLGAASRSSDLLRGFAGGIGTFYSKRDQTQLKKGKENKLAKTLNKVAARLQNTQDELTRLADSLGRF